MTLTITELMAFAIALFFTGWLINRARAWGQYLMGAGAVLYVILWIAQLLNLRI